VPAASSSPIPAVAQRLAAPAALAPDQCRDLLDYLAQITDPRHRRGRRHALTTVLAVAVCATLAGARSLVAIGEWASDAPVQVLAALGTRRAPVPRLAATRRGHRAPRAGPHRRRRPRPCHRCLAGCPAATTGGPSPPGRPPRRAVAVDGKTLRGTGHHGNPQVHLLAVMDHTSRRVLGQTDVQATTNEIARFRPLLDGLDLTDTVVTADALHTQREHADWLVTQKHSASLLVVKHNQPTLHHQLRRLPWRAIPVADHTRDRGHGRAELRRLQVTTVAGLDFPHAAQALRITRRVRFGGKEGLYHALSELWLRQEATLVHPESTLQDLLVAYLQASFDDPRMTRLLLWTGLASSAAPHERPPATQTSAKTSPICSGDRPKARSPTTSTLACSSSP
jgi:predicted transposase YbfD/YdcC